MRPVIIAIVVLAGCRKAPPSADNGPRTLEVDAKTAVAKVPLDAMPVDADVSECATILRQLEADVRSSFVAMESAGSYQDALAAWPAVPEACRDGRWYLAAARLLSQGSDPLVAPGVRLASRDEALVAAVQQPHHRGVLVYVARTAALGGAVALPADACDGARAAPAGVSTRQDADDSHYVCGHAALAASDAATAAKELAAIEVPGLYADVELRRAQAELALGHGEAARDLATKAAALDRESARAREITQTDWKALVAAANVVIEASR